MVGAIGPDHEENRAFLSFAKTFRGLGLPVPEIFAEDREAGVWLEEDLGDTTLFQALSVARSEVEEDQFPPEAEDLFARALAARSSATSKAATSNASASSPDSPRWPNASPP